MLVSKILQLTLFLLCSMPWFALGADRTAIDYGRWNETELEQIIVQSQQIDSPGEQIVALSNHFMGTPYVADSLVGDAQTAEKLVINLAGFDCFTFLDTLEALRRAPDIAQFPEEMKKVRYRDGKISYANRRHFFSDWVADESTEVADVTADVGQGRMQVVVKQLNLKSDGTHWLPEIPVVRREITYIPTDKIDKEVLSALQDGDYVGIYSDLDGLDVSHTGLIVKYEDGIWLRHASSHASVKRVVDVDLLSYLHGKPGLLVYRNR